MIHASRAVVSRAAAIGAVALLLLIAALATSSYRAMAAAQTNAQTIVFVGSEFAFSGPSMAGAGAAHIKLNNVGDQDHELGLARLEEGKTLADLQALFAQGEEAEGGEQLPPPWVVVLGGVPAIHAGEGARFTTVLTPGTYVLVCFVEDPADGVPHVGKGMVSSFTVGDTELPDADATVTMRDYAFDMSNTLPDGELSLHIANQGAEHHLFALEKLKPGKTMDEVNTYIAGLGPDQEPGPDAPFAEVWGTQFLSPGVEGVFYFNLGPGDYFAVCPIPTADGTPHFELGMIKSFKVQ